MSCRESLTGIDLFSGAGGLSLGASMAGVKVRYAVEQWAYADLSKESILSYGDLDFIKSIAGYIQRGSLPSAAQCKRLLKIVAKAEDKGYMMP